MKESNEMSWIQDFSFDSFASWTKGRRGEEAVAGNHKTLMPAGSKERKRTMNMDKLVKCDHCTEEQLRARIRDFAGSIVAEAAKAELIRRGLKI